MATPAQVLANRENAQHSTGPRSEEGRAKSSLNALRHGLASRGLIVLPGQESAFEQLEQGLRTGLQPSGELQDVLFKRILESAWNLHRCRLAEAQLYLNGSDPTVDPLLDVHNEAKYTRIQKYARQSESSMLRTVRELGKLQTEMQYRREGFPLTQEQKDDPEQFNRSVQALPELCQVDKVTSNLVRLPNRRNEANSFDATFIAMLDKFSAPPPIRPNIDTLRTQLAKAKVTGR